MSTTTYTDAEKPAPENLAQTLARELPKAHTVASYNDNDTGFQQQHIAVPRGHELKSIDNASLLPHPRRIVGTAALSDLDSFLEHIAKHSSPRSVVWCNFDPRTYALGFTAVYDEHDGANSAQKWRAGWRQHSATYSPKLSAEWDAWIGSNAKEKSQPEFARFIEDHEDDIASADGYPTSLQMFQLATEFEARQDQRIKSAVRLMSGGVQLEYVADDAAGTTERMKMFERFRVGIPVFCSGAAYPIVARLRYRLTNGAVRFWYELVRPDRVHETAAKELIDKVRAGLGNEVPLLMGAHS